MRRHYFRVGVDRMRGKRVDHSVIMSSEPLAHPHETIEEIVRADHNFVDEVVISPWLHVEAMSNREYWMNVAGVTLWVYLRKDGTVKRVDVYEAGNYDEEREGVKYHYE